jgi:HAD superfamily hydrolase (TIGR01509 family)
VIPPFPVYLFDLDGTLVDSATDICGAIQTVIASRHLPAVSDEFLRSYIGRHLIDLFQDLCPQADSGEVETWIQQYRETYWARNHASTRPYEGAVDTVAALGGRKATATTKSTATARTVLDLFGFLPSFQHVQGTDGFPAKPKPDVILRALEGLGARPEEALMVGDSVPDLIAARAAGVRTCAAAYGYANREALAAQQPDFWIEDIRELAR